MTIGTGIAVAGVWLFAGLLGSSRTTSSAGVWIGIFVASIVTAFLA